MKMVLGEFVRGARISVSLGSVPRGANRLKFKTATSLSCHFTVCNKIREYRYLCSWNKLSSFFPTLLENVKEVITVGRRMCPEVWSSTNPYIFFILHGVQALRRGRRESFARG